MVCFSITRAGKISRRKEREEKSEHSKYFYCMMSGFEAATCFITRSAINQGR